MTPHRFSGPGLAIVFALIAALPPGQQATLKVVRSQAEAEIKITIGKRPKQSRREE